MGVHAGACSMGGHEVLANKDMGRHAAGLAYAVCIGWRYGVLEELV